MRTLLEMGGYPVVGRLKRAGKENLVADLQNGFLDHPEFLLTLRLSAPINFHGPLV